VLPKLGRRHVADVTRADLSSLHHAMCATPGAANRVLALVSKMFGLAERWGLRPDGSNPARHVERFPERKMERFLSAQELARLGDALAEMEQAGTEPLEVIAAVRLLILTGARRGEILGLEWEHVDFDAACLRLLDSKEGGAKVIPLGAHALDVLAQLPRRSRWVLPTAAAVGPVSLSKPWDRIRKRAGLEDVRLHDLRHSFASVGVAGGDSLFIVGSILGHKRASTTERYAHLSDDPRRAATERIGARIAAAMDGKPDAEVVPLRRR
jgi:integrase